MVAFLLSLALSALVIVVTTLAGAQHGYFDRPSFLVPTMLMVHGLSAILFSFIYRINEAASFQRAYLLTVVVKLIVYFIYNMIMVFTDKPSAMENVVFFMVTYVVVTALEVTFYYRQTGRFGGPS